MTGESHSRPTQRISRFSQAYRTASQGGDIRAGFDRPVESVLSRDEETAEAPGAQRSSPQWQCYSPPEHAEVIEVEFETVEPDPAAPAIPEAVAAPLMNGDRKPEASAISTMAFSEDDAGDSQPPPPDIEAIAAALAAEMDRNAALQSKPRAEPPSRPPAAEPIPAAMPVPAAVPFKPFEPIASDDISLAAPSPALAEPESPTPAPPAPVAEQAAQTARPDVPVETGTSRFDLAGVKAAAASRTAQTATELRHIAARIRPLAGQARHFVHNNLGPAAVNAGISLARNLRRKELIRHYGKALALVHGRVIDRGLEQHFFIPSLSAERFAPAPERSILYDGPVPASSFNWVMSALPEDLREYAFVDFRAGLGRAMLLASQRRFERIIGYEYSAPGYDDLQMNIAQFPRSKMLCRDVECHRGDRTGVSIPDQPCVLYIASAWREEFLSGILTYLGDSYRHEPRRLFLILENVDPALSLPKSDVFHRLELPLVERLKLRLFSPMDFQVYRTLV